MPIAAPDQNTTRSVRSSMPGVRIERSVTSITAPPTPRARRRRENREAKSEPGQLASAAARNTTKPIEAGTCQGQRRSLRPSTASQAPSTTTSIR